MPTYNEDVMTNLNGDAIKKIRAALRWLSAEPKRLNMHDWGTIFDPKSINARKAARARVLASASPHAAKQIKLPACGAVGCMAGAIILLNTPKRLLLNLLYANSKATKDISRLDETIIEPLLRASQILDVEREVMSRLFHPTRWPSVYALKYYNAKTPFGRFEATEERAEFFIKTDGTDDHAVDIYS